MVRHFVALATILLFYSACVVHGSEYKLLDTRTEAIPAGALNHVKLKVDAGFLRIFGDREIDEVRIEAEFKGKTSLSRDAQAILNNLEFSHRVEGDTLVVMTRTRGSDGVVNLTLTLPSRLNLDIDDRSGSITIDEIGGDIVIDDSSGSIKLTDLGGSLRIEDSSGSIDIRDVKNDVEIEDSSGEIEVLHVAGNVVVSDSSGGIDVRDVEGDFEVVRDGSGSIHYSDIRGRVRLPSQR